MNIKIFFTALIAAAILTACNNSAETEANNASDATLPHIEETAGLILNPEHGMPGHRCDIAVGARDFRENLILHTVCRVTDATLKWELFYRKADRKIYLSVVRSINPLVSALHCNLLKPNTPPVATSVLRNVSLRSTPLILGNSFLPCTSA